METGADSGTDHELTLTESLATQECRRFQNKVAVMIRHEFRGLFGQAFCDRWGFFVDRHLSALVHRFISWMTYPKGNLVFRAHSDSVVAAVVSSDGRVLFTGSHDRCIAVFNLEIGELIHKWEAHEHHVTALAYHPGVLASGSFDNSVRLWHSDTGVLIRTLLGHSGTIRSLSFSRSGDCLVSSSVDRSVRVWSVVSGECVFVLTGHEHYVTSVLFVGAVVISGSWDRSLREWDPCEGTELRSTKDGLRSKLTDLCLNCDGSLMVCLMSGILCVFSWPEFSFIEQLEEYDAYVGHFHPRLPRVMAVGGFNRAKVIDLAKVDRSRRISSLKGACVAQMTGHTGTVKCVRFTPDGQRLISVSLDCTVRIWDVSDSLPELED